MDRVIYVDNNATTMVAPEVVEAMEPYFTELYGNPSSLHNFGGQVAKSVKNARKQVAALIGAEPEEIIFTSCGTESDTTAIRAALNSQPRKKHIITTAVEHPAVIGLCEHLEKNEGYAATYLDVDRHGRLDLGQFEANITDATALVTIMHANNETGVIFPVKEITAIAAAHDVPVHTDAVQSVGKIPVDVDDLGVDYLSMSGHKIHASKGIGVLYVRSGAPYEPLLIGGHQEDDRRAGTENVPSIIGIGRAAELAAEHIEEERTRVEGLRHRMEACITQTIEDSYVNGADVPRLPNTLSISFDYVEGESILLMLDQAGICASTGSACSSASLEVSHVIEAMGVPPTCAHGSMRFSLSRYNTEDEIDFICEELPQIIDRLRTMSPFSRDRANMDVQ